MKEEYVASALNQYLNEPINMDFSKQGEKIPRYIVIDRLNHLLH